VTQAEFLVWMERNGLGQPMALLAGQMELW